MAEKKLKPLKEKNPANWLVPDRLLAAQSRYNINRLKREIVKYPKANAMLKEKLEEIVMILGMKF